MPTLLAAALAALAAAPAARADAQAANPSHEVPFDATVRFLQEDQNMDGGFGGEAGWASDPDISSWVALALAAADINPHDQAKPGGTDVYTYLAEHAGELESTTDFERALLVVDATEYPPRPLGGVDLVAKILERRLPSGAFTHEAGSAVPGMNDTIFAILALSPITEPAIESVVQQAAEWVISEQDEDGSWPSWCPKSVCAKWEDGTDMTGAAIEALNAAGMPGTEAQARALAYLHELQLPDGGWAQRRGEGESNVGSAAWVVQGIWAAGENPETWRTGTGQKPEEPLDYIASLIGADGEARYAGSHQSLGVWMTAYVTPALAGRALPIVPPPARLSPPQPGDETGDGSADGGGDTGVIAGGGGDGAPKFSRPKRGSKGRTPGGARIVRGEGLRARDHSASRRGANRRQATGTEAAEPRRAAEADQEVEAVGQAASVEEAGSTAMPASRPPSEGQAGRSASDREGRGARSREKRPADRGGRSAEHDDRGGVPPANGARRARSARGGDEVTGTLIGSPTATEGKLAYGAPGLRGAGGGGEGYGTAIAIGAAALLAALLGAGWERRRGLVA